ncbi:30S ribosomal protein S16 [Pontibacter qinzhouensis]|uniref:Small ribosomal subunit protein bS16 n=1 Tax=Pontibacter qinzhouensis TaxID=2603253 RepID=A0A5C8KBL7_9BACT|nr:30S ribosomal protein S16 [Pontibacter qinzhouensis]TXK47138.1 30S ribosomal protein S16 [Pontibacter qinzhouensis]
MAVKIRLARRGRKKAAIYDIVIADARSPRDGKFIEKLGIYNPNTNPASIDYNEEKAFQWLMNGAQPTDTVKAMLSYSGILFRKHLQIGVLKGAITQETADARFAEWKEVKDAKIESKRQTLGATKEAAKKAAFEAETKVKEARAEAIRQREAAKVAANAPAAEAEAEAPAEGEATTEEQA